MFANMKLKVLGLLLLLTVSGTSLSAIASGDMHDGVEQSGSHAGHMMLETHASHPTVHGLRGVKVVFELPDHEGKLVTEGDFVGKFMLLGFGFTRCEHVCPVMAANMAKVLRSVNKEAVGIFISVDTERDTPAITHRYAQGFSRKIVGLGGSYNQVSTAAGNFMVSYVVTKTQNNYTVQHSSNIYLIDPTGKLVGTFALNADSADIAAAMQ